MRAGTRAGLVPVCPHRTWHKGTQAEHALGIACVTVEREMAYERFLRTTVVSCLSLLIPPGLSSNSASFRKPSKTFHAGSGAPLPALPHLSPTPPPQLSGASLCGDQSMFPTGLRIQVTAGFPALGGHRAGVLGDD